MGVCTCHLSQTQALALPSTRISNAVSPRPDVYNLPFVIKTAIPYGLACGLVTVLLYSPCGRSRCPVFSWKQICEI